MVSSQNIIPRNSVIPGARDDTFRMKPLVAPPAVVEPKVAVVTLTAEHLQAISGNPISLVPSPGPGKTLLIAKVVASKEPDAYTTGRALSLNYGVGGPEWGRFATAVFTAADASSDIATPAKPSWATPFPPTSDLVASANNNFAGAGGDVTITVTYFEVSNE